MGLLGSRLRRGRHEPRPAPRLSRGRCRGSRSDPGLRRHADGRHDRGARGRRGRASWSARVGSSEASLPCGCPAGRAGWTRTRLGRSSSCTPATRRSSPSSTRTCRASSASSSTAARPSKPARCSSMRFTSGGPQLPEQDRPRLIVFGASLGASGAERPFVGPDVAASVANFASRADGALIVGSLGWNPILRQLTDARDPGSPAWQPSYAGGETVRFADRRQPARPRHGLGSVAGALPAAPRRPGRVPVARFAVVAAGMDGRAARPTESRPTPAGSRSSRPSRPLADLSFAASLPSGFGHDYRVDYVDAFARIAPPDAWTDDDTARLEAYLDADAADRRGRALTDLRGLPQTSASSPRR